MSSSAHQEDCQRSTSVFDSSSGGITIGAGQTLRAKARLSALQEVKGGAAQAYAGAYRTEGLAHPLYQLMASGLTDSTARKVTCTDWRKDMAGLRRACAVLAGMVLCQLRQQDPADFNPGGVYDVPNIISSCLCIACPAVQHMNVMLICVSPHAMCRRPLGECAYVDVPNFGMVEIDWDARVLSMQIRDAADGVRVLQHYDISLDTCLPLPGQEP